MAGETRTRVWLPSTRKAPNPAESIWPMTVAVAAPTTPQSKTMMNSASSTMLVSAPIPVTHMPRMDLPDTRTKSQKSWDSPWNRQPRATMR